MGEPLIRPSEAAGRLGVSLAQLRTLPIAHYNFGPRTYRYAPADIEQFKKWEATIPARRGSLSWRAAMALRTYAEDGVYVYFARSGAYVKVGHSRCPEGRIEGFACGSPFPIEIMSYHPGGREAERALHRLFDRYHHSLEWFRLDPALMRAIDDLGPGCRAHRGWEGVDCHG